MSDEATKRDEGGRESSADVAFVTRGRLMQVCERNILFSSSRQEIFDLNDTAAKIWCALKEGQSPNAIAQGLGGTELPDCEAVALIETVLAEWENLDLVYPVRSSVTEAASLRSQVVSVARTQIRLSYETESAYAAASSFRHLEVSGTTADLKWEVADSRGRLHLFRGGDWVGSCRPVELPTVLKGHILTEVLNVDDYEIALHTAALESNGRAILISGPPGAGKTTLTLALASRGLIYGGDDVTLVTRQGRCVSLPFAPAVKSGSWAILESWLDGLGTTPIFRRPDGRRVRYPSPDPFRRLTDCPIGWIILIDRRHGARAELTPIDAAEAFRGLLSGAFVGGGDLTEGAFEALALAFQSAELYRLSYSELSDAVDVVRRTCR